MTASTEVARQGAGSDIAEYSDVEKELLAQQDEAYAGLRLTLPLLKIGQALTTEVQDGEAEAGDYINALTGESLGSSIEFIVAVFQKGRFRSVDGGGTYVVVDENIVPETWTDDDDLPFIGRPFYEHPDAEEQFKARVNAKEIPWGSGPPIQTTFNFTGLVLGHDSAVRLSLKSTHVKAANRWLNLIQGLSKAPWDIVYDLGTRQDENASKQKFYVPTVKRSRFTEAAERQSAVELAQRVRGGNVEVAGEDAGTGKEAARKASEKAEREAQAAGGLGV